MGPRTILRRCKAFVLYLGLHRFFAEGSSNHTTCQWANRTWALTGLGWRAASSITLSSGSDLDVDMMSPFEHEMRKRLGLTLWYLEHRSDEDVGRVVSDSPWTTSELATLPFTSPPPTSAHDADLHPRMRLPPTPHRGWAEISFSLLQVEIATATRMARAASTLAHKGAIIAACEGRVRAEYLQHCDGSLTVHWLTRHVSHVLRFEVYGYGSGCQQPLELAPQAPNPQFLLLVNAMDMLNAEKHVREASEPQAAQWRWLLTEYLQFWPLAFLLGRLSSQPSLLGDVVLAERAWQVAERSFHRWECPGGKNPGSSYMQTLRRLWSQAQEARMRVVAPRVGQWFGTDHVVVGAGADVPVLYAAVFGGSTKQDKIWQAEDVDALGGGIRMMNSDVSRLRCESRL